MKPAILLLFLTLMNSHLPAHGPESPDWYAVNDGVMGGVSAGAAVPLDNGVIRFAGILSLENNGGFASIRADSPAFAFTRDGSIVLRVKGDGRTYTLDLRTARRQGAFSYKQAFQTVAGEVTEVRLPLTRFQATAFGRQMPVASPLDPARVVSLGFMLADKQPGPFRLDVLSLGFEATTAPVADSPGGLIDLAISHGVPLYNRGDADACAAVYATALHALILMPDTMVSREVKDRIEQDMNAMDQDGDASATAWGLRHALDRARAGL